MKKILTTSLLFHLRWDRQTFISTTLPHLKNQCFFSILLTCIIILNGVEANAQVNPNATKETKALKDFLDDNYKNKMISGQYGTEWCDYVKTNTGKTPAILGNDFMDYTPKRRQEGANPTATETAIDWYNNKHGIVTFSWHWDAPTDIYDTGYRQECVNVTGGDARWYKAFYTCASWFDIQSVMNNPGGTEYQLILRDIDIISGELQKLQNAGVPVLWRPLHEAEGGWFWWGAKGPDAFKKLYRLMYDRMVNYHKLNNLIWVFNSYDYSNSTSWYPGDDVVDIIAYDYPSGNTWNNYQNMFGGKSKPFSIAECSNLPDPNNFSSQSWLYFVNWVNFIKDNNSVDYIKRVYGDSRVISLEDLPDLKNYGSVVDSSLSLNKPVEVSSTEANYGNVASNAVDGKTNTRWSSLYSDPQWIKIDLGAVYTIQEVVLKWEAAYAKAYKIEVSVDGNTWTSIYETTNGDGGTDDLKSLSGSGRYVRMYGTQRTTQWGYSLYEFEVFGTPVNSNNKPIANAGTDITVKDSDNNGSEQVSLDGSGSSDSDGSIVSYVWKENGIQLAAGVNPSVTFLVGTHTVVLEVTDNGSLKASDTVVVIVNPSDNNSSDNLALNKPVTISSTEASYGNIASKAVDGDNSTRWSSVYSDPQWISVDLGAAYNIQEVILKWENAFGKAYRIEVSNNGSTWTSIFQTVNGDGGTDDIKNLSGSGRYIRMYGTQRGTQWGYSLFEFEVYGSKSTTVSPNIFEAEDGVLTGVYVEKNLQGYSGTGYVNGFDNAGDKVAINVPVDIAGNYNLSIRYAAPYSEKKNYVAVNGQNLGEIDFPQSSSWQEVAINNITLNAGSNTIEIIDSWGWFYVDRISVTQISMPQPIAASQITQPSLNTYPNPAGDIINLDFNVEENKSATVIISKMEGMEVYRSSIGSGDTHSINVSGLQDGIYFLTIISEGGTVTNRIEIRR